MGDQYIIIECDGDQRQGCFHMGVIVVFLIISVHSDEDSLDVPFPSIIRIQSDSSNEGFEFFASERSLKNMANNTEIAEGNSTLNPEFVQQLIPSAERTALLYNLTFLSLGGFPKLERIIRDQAIETQLLFGSSEAVLLKCVVTSSNLVTSLFPILKKAVEKNKPALAVKYLMKAKEWISDIITKVDDMVKRGYTDAMKDPTAIALDRKLKDLNSDKILLKSEKWNIKIKLTDLQLQLANCKIRLGEIPDPDHLKEVQLCLSQIQQILVELKKFWEKVDVILHGLKDKTFAGDELVDMEDMKEEFISSIEDAGHYWKRFGMSCQRAHGIFSVESKDAYKFLGINPSSLSEEDRQKEYSAVTEKLRNINAKGLCGAAITAK
ncbi:restin-like protein [Labeo rohita]|uniref:Restin-like protein n=1 Tax=Labeo rohita TaxID=84645 RepID=A0A498NPY2_LABRO|nr:restin-like protein [Labeo rohita]